MLADLSDLCVSGPRLLGLSIYQRNAVSVGRIDRHLISLRTECSAVILFSSGVGKCDFSVFGYQERPDVVVVMRLIVRTGLCGKIVVLVLMYEPLSLLIIVILAGHLLIGKRRILEQNRMKNGTAAPDSVSDRRYLNV